MYWTNDQQDQADLAANLAKALLMRFRILDPQNTATSDQLASSNAVAMTIYEELIQNARRQR